MKNAQLYLRLIFYMLLLYFLILMIQITLPYLALRDDVSFLRIKRKALQYDWWRIAFYVHVFSSSFILLAGFTQFSKIIIKVFPTVHRCMGRLYVILILCLAGPSGFIMGVMANGGFFSRASFLILSILWCYTTFKAYKFARNQNWKKHRNFMWRSFALSLSAITLRAWKVCLVYVFAPPPMDLYRLVAWLGWGPNLLFIEWYIHRKRISLT